MKDQIFTDLKIQLSMNSKYLVWVLKTMENQDISE